MLSKDSNFYISETCYWSLIREKNMDQGKLKKFSPVIVWLYVFEFFRAE